MKIGVAIVHGVGMRSDEFAQTLSTRIAKLFENHVSPHGVSADDALVFKLIRWSRGLADRGDDLKKKSHIRGPLGWNSLRGTVINLAGDAIAYQPRRGVRTEYDRIHVLIAHALQDMAQRAGDDAPLCVIAHSLGTVIMMNYFNDLQGTFLLRRTPVDEEVEAIAKSTSLGRGETLIRFFSLGTPIHLWSLSLSDLGAPLIFPPPALSKHLARSKPEWVNIYSKSDVIGNPLKVLNSEFYSAVTEDLEVRIWGPLSCWTPFAHVRYWRSRRVAKRIAASLATAWIELNADPKLVQGCKDGSSGQQGTRNN